MTHTVSVCDWATGSMRTWVAEYVMCRVHSLGLSYDQPPATVPRHVIPLQSLACTHCLGWSPVAGHMNGSVSHAPGRSAGCARVMRADSSHWANPPGGSFLSKYPDPGCVNELQSKTEGCD